MEEKQKLPKPKLTQKVKNVIENILKKRLEQRYDISLEVNKKVILFEIKKKINLFVLG